MRRCEKRRRDRHDRDSSDGNEERSAAALRARVEVARQEVDGAHQSSIPRPMATASEPAASGRLRAHLDPPERIAQADRDADESPTASGKPSMCAVPPVRTTSPMPSAPGCA